MKKKYLYLLLRVLVYLLVLGAILYGLYESPYNPHPHSAEDIRRWVVGFGVWAPLIYVAVYTIRPLLLFPTLLLNLSSVPGKLIFKIANLFGMIKIIQVYLCGKHIN